MEGTPLGDALPPPPQRATPARKGARIGAGAGSTRPHRPHPGHTGCGTLAARSRGRAAGGRTAPDTRRPTQRWKAPPPGTPFRHPHSEQRRPARAHAGGPLLGTHARIDRTRDTRVAEPRPPAPEDGRSGEGQRLTPGAPHNTVEGTPPGDALPPPPQRATPARKGARCGAGAGSTCPHRPHPGHTGRGTPAARSRGRAAGGGTAPDTKRPSQRRKAPPPGDALPPSPQRATPARKGARWGAGDGYTRPYRPHPGRTGRGTLAARSRGRAAGGGTAPDTRRPSQRWKAPPPGTPFRHPHSEQHRPARAHVVGPVQRSHARTDRTQDTRDAEPWLPAPEDRRPGAAAPATPSQVGGNRDRTAPPQARQTEHGTGAGHAEGHGPSGTALPAPSAGTTRDARATPPSGGGSGHRESASAHTRKEHAGTTGRATGPSARNAQTAWNGVPASEGKGHPEGTARHTQRGTRGAGRGKQERHNTRYRPEPPPNRPRAPRTH